MDPLVLYFQRIEKLKVNDSVLSYNQKKAEKQVQLLRIRAREFNFPYEKNGVLQIIEDTRTRDTGQEKFLIILLTKNQKISYLSKNHLNFFFSFLAIILEGSIFGRQPVISCIKIIVTGFTIKSVYGMLVYLF